MTADAKPSSSASPNHCAAFCRRSFFMTKDAPEESTCLPGRRISGVAAAQSTLQKLPIFNRSPSPAPSAPPSGRSAGASATLVPPAEQPAFEELLVLVHGLQGTVEDFTFFEQQLARSAPAAAGQLLVHSTDVNTEKTHDGVVEGGARLAGDIRGLVAQHLSLERISLVGFSLGGVYARYAAGLLYDLETGTMAGLKPQTFVTVASPHLGVRRFGVYRYLPQQLLGATKFLFGKTGDELVMNDGTRELEPLMVKMSKDEGPGGLQFLSALAKFKKRVVYGNMRQDFMVNFGTAVLDHSVQGIGGQDLQDHIRERASAANAQAVDHEHDGKGCKVAFSYSYPLPGDGDTEDRDNDGGEDGGTYEALMAKRLRSIGWKVVAIDFPLHLPVAHNRIMAMSRGPIHTWMNAPGRRAVLHVVDVLVGHFSNHEPLFKSTASPAVTSSHAGILDDGGDDAIAEGTIAR